VKFSKTEESWWKYCQNMYKEKEKREETIHSVIAENR
jgi:hypothetical protein